MPYIDQESRNRMEKNEGPKTEGDINYCFYKVMLKEWKNNPRYSTIHKIKKAINKFKKGDYESELVEKFNDSVEKNKTLDLDDQDTAIDLAFMEFYQRVGIPYENAKMAENGDIEV